MCIEFKYITNALINEGMPFIYARNLLHIFK